MKLRPSFLLAALGVCLAVSPAGAVVRLLESDASRVLVEIVPEPAEITTQAADGRDYVRLRIPEMGVTDHAGLPELPASAVRLAVPPNTIPRLRVVQAEWSPRQPGAVLPAPHRIGKRDPLGPNQVVEEEAPEEALYRSRTIHPEQPFRLSEVMGIRNSRVVEVEYFGAQAETFARGYRLLRRAVLEVTFEAPRGRSIRRMSERPAVPQELWSRTMRSGVLNQAQAPEWARGGPGDAPSVGDQPWGGGTQWKVEVNETGLFEIPFSALSALGFPGGVPVASVSVYQRVFDLDAVDDPGTSAADLFQQLPVPVLVRDRNTNGTFDLNDGIVVWGRSVRDQWMTSGWEHEDRHDTRNFVFVRVDGAGGARMAIVPGILPDAGADSLACTPHTVFRENDRRYSQYAADFGPGRDAFETEFFYWNDQTTPTSGAVGWTFTDPFLVENIQPDSTAALLARVCPTGKPIFGRFTNDVEFNVNATQVGNRGFYNEHFYSFGGVVNPDSVMNSHVIPAGLLTNGSNDFSFRGRSYNGFGNTDVAFVARFLFDWYQIEYHRQLVASGGKLRLSTRDGTAGDQRIRVRGFGGTDLLLFDVTDPAAPALVSLGPGQVVAGGGGLTDLRFGHDNGPGATTPGEYFATRETNVRIASGPEITAVAPSSALAAGAGAQYVVITHDRFVDGAAELAEYRSSRYSTQVATVSELYDLFGGGRIHPDAFKAYAAYGFHRWSQPLVFLCLIGDASEDHRHVESDSDEDLLPSHSLWAAHEGAPEESDQYFAELTKDGTGAFDRFSDIYVGRLALNTTEELDWNIQRIRAYENEGIDQLWRRRVLLLADDALSGDLDGSVGNGYGWRGSEVAFCSASESYEQLLADHPVDALLPDLFCWSEFSHPCPDSCNRHGPTGSGDCESEPGVDCGIWYDCRRIPYTNDGWRQEVPCQREAVNAVVLPILREKLDNGVFIWNYQGHANRFQLAHEEVWYDIPRGRSDVDFMANEGKPFLFLGFACHLSEFDRDDERLSADCLAEKMMNVRQTGLERPGGCVASFSSSGFEFLGPNLDFNRYVLEAFYYPERLLDSGLPAGTALPDDGDPNAYVWTVGEATTRARLLFQERYGSQAENSRQAARRFILLGDPALSPDFGTPTITVTVNGQTVEDPSLDFFAAPADFPDDMNVTVTATDGRGVSSMRVTDSQLGEVDPANYTVVTNESTDDGVPQSRTLSYDFQLREDVVYALSFEALDGAGHAAKFTLRTDTRFEFVNDQVAVYPNPFSNRTHAVFQLTSRAAEVEMSIYTPTGRQIVERNLGSIDANEQAEIEWDGRDDHGLPVANGTYFLRLKLSGSSGSIEKTLPIVRMQ